MATSYTSPNWVNGSGEGVSAHNLQAISDCLEDIIKGSDKAIHDILINGSTITLTYVDGTIETKSSVNIKGIVSIEQTSTSGLVDTYTITYTDGTTSTFEVTNGEAGTDPNAYHTNDGTINGSLDNNDMIPFYQNSSSATKKTSWSNFKSRLKTYFDTLYNKITVSIGASSGSAAYNATKSQQITIDGVATDIDGTKYLETSSTSTPSTGTTRFTFTHSSISSNGVYDFYCDKYGVAPLAVTISSTTMYVDFNSSDSVTECRVYIRG